MTAQALTFVEMKFFSSVINHYLVFLLYFNKITFETTMKIFAILFWIKTCGRPWPPPIDRKGLITADNNDKWRNDIMDNERFFLQWSIRRSSISHIRKSNLLWIWYLLMIMKLFPTNWFICIYLFFFDRLYADINLGWLLLPSYGPAY